MLRRLLSLTLCLLCAALTAAPPTPPPPAVWNIELRYQINAFRTERLRQYAEMTGVLRSAGFERDPDEIVADDEPENLKYRYMRGTVPAKGVVRLLQQRHIRCVLLYPKGTKLEKGGRVRIDLLLTSGYIPATQKLLAQTAAVLTKGAGFLEAVGYDRRGDTRLVGSVPVADLGRLLEDVRLVRGADAQPGPFRNVSAVRAIYARPDWPVPGVMPPLPVVPPGQEKFTPELRALLADAAGAAAPGRLEVILGYTPAAADRLWQKALDVEDVVIEGRLGPLVTVQGVPKDVAAKLAEIKEVATVRLPRQAQHAPAGRRDEVPAKWEPVRASGLARLHALGYKGRGQHIALVADDFQGWETLKNRKDGKIRLPDPVLLDLTAERRRDLLPDPFPPPGKDAETGYGTRCAALLKAAPEAELTLLRIDGAAPYMLETLARFINGEDVHTVAMESRFKELMADRASLDARRDELLEERRRVLNNFSEEAEPAKLRADYQAKQAAFNKKEEDHRSRQRRYLKLLRDLKALRGVRVVASALVWTEGYPVDGSSTLSRYFDDRPFRAALWFQAAGDTGGQAWAGLFRDGDANGVMEFADPRDPLPKGAWTPELNFLSWRSGGKSLRDVPAGAVIRLTLQWREAHDSLPLRLGEDVYREPLAKLRLMLVHQPDPDGISRPADDLEVVAQTAGSPQRLNQTLNSATYEHILEFRPTKAGRYGVFILGKGPDGIQAAGEVSLPSTKKVSELHVRLFAHTLGGAGRATWSDYTTKTAALGMPADARRVIAVGAATADNRVRPSSASGSPFHLTLLRKPDVYAYDEGAGTAQAASFAAGLAGSSWESKGTLFGVLEALRVRPGEVLRVPQK